MDDTQEMLSLLALLQRSEEHTPQSAALFRVLDELKSAE